MTKILKICSCGTTSLAEVGQSFINGKLRWYLSFRCPCCGKANEIDGMDDIPIEIRDAILQQEGEWGLVIEDSSKVSSVLKVLRRELNLSFNEIVRLKKSIPGIVLTGTKIEMERLREALSFNNINSSILKIENN
ncbi:MULTISPECIES: hypothetical protein [unclassified Clostridium]|uniref:hypothetical protein n=1 Tax=unclassified Clostridium TaxID=2614128 RepID=UPI0020792634|nr:MULTISPECIES: hypothetical protein [unclassified Clostridium]